MMKKAILAVALAGFAQVASAAIAGSAHDLTAAGSGNGGLGYGGTFSTCSYCHTPHNANATITGAPLWNRVLPTAASFVPAQTTLSGNAWAIGANSLTCLSCHDGATAMGDTLNIDDAGVPALAAGNYANFGKDLLGNHPVGITYPAVIVGGPFKTPTGTRLYSSKIECASCHDPHGTAAIGGDSDGASAYTAAGVGAESFLRVDAGDLCADCHTK